LRRWPEEPRTRERRARSIRRGGTGDGATV